MGRIVRHPFKAACVALGLISLAIAWLWIRSYSTTDTLFVVYKKDGSEQISTQLGKLVIRHLRPESGDWGGFKSASHRAERLRSLPPPLWSNVPRERRWLFFWFVNVPPPSARTLADMMAWHSWMAMTEVQQAQAVQSDVDAYLKAHPASARDPSTYEESKNLIWYDHYTRLMMNNDVAKSNYLKAMPSRWELVIPLWVLLGIVGILPAAVWFALTRNRARRVRNGCCEACGYDLRATPDRCPECGLTPSRKTNLSRVSG